MTDRYGSESPLSATWRPTIQERAVLVGLAPDGDQEALDELAALATAAGAEPVGRVVQTRSSPDPATFVGKGKLGEIHELVHATSAEAVILDDELSPGQLRNLEERLRVKVLDRTALILDIFALHARSGEGKAQVELAQLNYLLPRLRGWGEAMSRLGGGIGTRGPGETKLEIDRQHIRRRIAKLRRDIADLARTRGVKRANRERSGIPQVALVGYTNAGKSTLMNALTDAETLVANQPFATLDPTTRRLILPGGRRVIVSDTVGFVRKLPHDLVEAFKSTLEEVTRAHLLLHVADASARELEEQISAVRDVLAAIGAGHLPEVLALNKMDRLSPMERTRVLRRHPEGEAVSALTGDGVNALLLSVQDAVPRPPIEVSLHVPFDHPDVVPWLHREAEVVSVDSTEDGTAVVARVTEAQLPRVQTFLTEPVARRVSS
ncbi:MAG TPA: GTPase HflX [Actinomycetota bacterium]|nr:GTPase HflX [Actinomycetota bacterium]